MRASSLLTLIAMASLASSSASAQEGAPSLDGVGRIAILGGWHYSANSTFYDRYYSQPANTGLARAARSPGGPMITGTFAYGITELVEVGIDLFASGERLQLTGQPRLTTASYGGMIGLRFRGWVDMGPEGMVPFLGILSGPLLAVAAFDGEPLKETLSQSWGGTAGVTWRLNSAWGVNVEYRIVFARGAVGRADQNFGSFNAGGNWFSVGVNYTFPRDNGPASNFPF